MRKQHSENIEALEKIENAIAQQGHGFMDIRHELRSLTVQVGERYGRLEPAPISRAFLDAYDAIGLFD